MEYVKFNNGKFCPSLGLGCGLLQTTDPEILARVVDRALELGYRHFDTGYVYQNESILGNVFKKWMGSGKLKREDLFITSKLPSIGMQPSMVKHFLQLSLAALQVDYVDLYLIHGPYGSIYVSDADLFPKKPDGSPLLDMTTNLEAIWTEMEAQVNSGLAKSIGISNFAKSQVRRILKSGKIVPANIQVEFQAYFQQKELHALCQEFNISITGYGALGSSGRVEKMNRRGLVGIQFVCPPLLTDPCITELAQKYKKTPAQILLRHLIQLGIIPVVTSSNMERLAENLKVFDFHLDQRDLQKMIELDKGEAGRSFTAAVFAPGTEKHPEFSFNH